MAYKHKATGYYYWKTNENKMIYLHRDAVRDLLGRDILPTEVVHHIDEDRSNNDLSNLMVFKTNGDHVTFHNLKEQDRELLRLEDGSYICRRKLSVFCPVCGSGFAPRTRNGKVSQKYCSHSCAAKSRQAINSFAEKNTLHKDVWDRPVVEVAKSLGISDRGVLKRCEKYGIPTPGRGFWNKIKANKLEGQSCPLPLMGSIP